MMKVGLGIAAVVVIAWFAFPPMRTNLAAIASFAIVLICPLAMFFGMRGHGNHGAHHGHGGNCSGKDASVVSSKDLEKGLKKEAVVSDTIRP